MIRGESVDNLFADFRVQLYPAVPELVTALDSSATDTLKTQRIYTAYTSLFREMSALSDDDYDRLDRAYAIMTKRPEMLGSASTQGLLHLLDSVNDPADIAAMAEESTNPQSRHFRPAINDFVGRLVHGHDYSLTHDEPPKDGDPEGDRMIWSHTRIDPAETTTMLHFMSGHYLERYFVQAVPESGIVKAVGKDAIINAMGDMITLLPEDHPAFLDAALLNTWRTPKPDGGLGWLSETRILTVTNV